MITPSLDDKLFSFWHLQGDSHPYSRVKGIYRFETGIKVNEFRDLRANPRCLLESQLMSFRIKWARMIATGVLGAKKTGISQSPPLAGRPSSVLSSLGLPFDAYDATPLPARVISTGAAANFPSIANLVGDIFNAPIFVPTTQVDSAQISPHRNAPAQGYPSRASIGGAYVARWVWGREWGVGGLDVFEDEVKRLLGKRWVATGKVPLRTNINGATSIGGGITLAPGSGANSGTSTPFGGPRSNLGATVFAEEDEDELELERNDANPSLRVGNYGNNAFLGSELGNRLRTSTGSTADTLGSSQSSGPTSTTYTTPDVAGLGVPGSNGNNASSTPTTSQPLVPVTPLPTSEAEVQIGLAKVAEPDFDAFMSYASIVPEYYRLENMLIKGIV